MIVVGLGPGDASYLSAEAREVLEGAQRLFVRTLLHPTLDQLDIEPLSFDELYENADTFEEVYEQIVERLLEEEKKGEVVYAVPGSPFTAERSVELLLKRAPHTKVIPGVSFLEPLLAKLRIDVSKGLRIVDALSDFRADPRENLLILQVYSREIASRVKLQLAETHHDEAQVIVAGHVGVEESEYVHERKLWELDRIGDFDHLSSVYVPASEEDSRAGLRELEELMDRLLGPGGCPWDREQSHASLRRYLIEECYEVIDAIDREDFADLEDELGDLLFQVVFHSALAKQEGYFRLDDVVAGSYDKIYSRHSHVFGEDAAGNPDAVVDLWEKNKGEERSLAERLERVPKLSPLHYAQKVVKLLGLKTSQAARSQEEIITSLKELVLEANQAGYSLDALLMEEVKRLLKKCKSETK